MESFNEVFDAVCEFCKKEVSSVAYNSWIRTIEPVKFENGTAYLSVNTDFKRGIIEEKYLGLLTKAFSEVLGFDVAVTREEQAKDLSVTARGKMAEG